MEKQKEKEKAGNFSESSRLRNLPKFIPRKGADVDDYSDIIEKQKNNQPIHKARR